MREIFLRIQFSGVGGGGGGGGWGGGVNYFKWMGKFSFSKKWSLPPPSPRTITLGRVS